MQRDTTKVIVVKRSPASKPGVVHWTRGIQAIQASCRMNLWINTDLLLLAAYHTSVDADNIEPGTQPACRQPRLLNPRTPNLDKMSPLSTPTY